MEIGLHSDSGPIPGRETVFEATTCICQHFEGKCGLEENYRFGHLTSLGSSIIAVTGSADPHVSVGTLWLHEDYPFAFTPEDQEPFLDEECFPTVSVAKI